MSSKDRSDKNKIQIREDKAVARLKQEMSFISTYKNSDIDVSVIEKSIGE